MNTERFRNGDVIYSRNIIAIIASIGNCGKIRHHCYYHARFNMCSIQEDYGIGNINEDGIRLATDEEKQKLFNAIKANGYKWNAKTKTLEKLIKPKFKVGDIIRHKENGNIVKIVDIDISDSTYCCGLDHVWVADQGRYELVPNKFDISTLKPFDKVLARQDNRVWECDIFSSYDSNERDFGKFHCVGGWYKECIPYEGNEYLLGTTNDCDDFYKNWCE